MNLRSYINLYEILKNDKSSKEERRSFGLTYVLIQHHPVEQLLAWMQTHIKSLKQPLVSDILASYLYGLTFILVILSFLLGLFSGIALLSYSGHEPVNVVYFIAMVVFMPLFTMTLALFSMLKVQSKQSVLVHLSPAYWMEKILSLLPRKIDKTLRTVRINPLLSNWIVIKRSQYIALFFSIGLLIALLAVISTKDIAFAWSTTLHISAESFHHFLHTLALPWAHWFPSAVPSLDLIEKSQYFRLGDKLSEEMLANAANLGEWWKFLAFATLFYAIFLRFLVYIVASVGYYYGLKKSFLTLDGVNELLRDMNEPIISTRASNKEELHSVLSDKSVSVINNLDASYDVVQGWAMDVSQLRVLNDSMHVISPDVHEVGGGNTFDQDSEIVSKSKGEVLLYVKAWEPPTMDFMDYLEELLQKVDKVVVYPVGTAENVYVPQDKFVDIWMKKLSLITNNKVWLKR